MSLLEPTPSTSEPIQLQRIRSSCSVVQFNNIEIIELPYTVGDHPFVSNGCPLSVEWKAQKTTTLALDFFEKHRPARSKSVSRISSKNRTKLLRRSECSDHDIEQAAANSSAARRVRMNTLYAMKKVGDVKDELGIASTTLPNVPPSTFVPNISMARSA